MNTSSIESKIEYLSDIPETIQRGLLDLFSIRTIDELTQQKKSLLKNSIAQLFSTTALTEYDEYCRAYALYYLPVNMQKIWRPLLDLTITDSLEPSCRVLELGSGPGSATIGLIEFYKYLAYDNYSTEFYIDITVVERESAFLRIFDSLMEQYTRSLPSNLNVSIKPINADAADFLDHNENSYYNLIIESNMLNPNEHISACYLEDIAHNLIRALGKHSSLIFIEPAKQGLTDFLRTIKAILLREGLCCYSPCCCENQICGQFASAQLNIKGISLCKKLYENDIITRLPDYHAFEYAVFRNDTLQKYDYSGSDSILCDLRNHGGELISFKAFVCAIAHPDDDVFALKVCDGSIPENKSVWMNIPRKSLLEPQINTLTCGRGGMIDIKNAVVEAPNKLGVCRKTRIRIYK